MTYPFNVRVYGALISNAHILVSHEHYQGLSFTKLPGGGLEFGEGMREALHREFMEELGIEVRVGEHIYTTDFFIASAFNPEVQLISVYFRVHWAAGNPEGPSDLPELQALGDSGQVLTWKQLTALSEADFTFPVDKHIVPLLRGLDS